MPVPGPDKALCGAQRMGQPDGIHCKNVAGYGTDHLGTGKCKRHGGSTPSHEKSAQLGRHRQAAAKLGLSVEIDPGEALLQAVYEAEGNLSYYREQVNELGSLITTEYSAGGGSKEVAHPLVVLYHEAERWRARVAVDTLKAGVDERRMRLVEADAAFLFKGIGIAAAKALMTPEQAEAFRRAYADYLRTEPAQLTR